jgi:hypothetical protein
MLRPLRFTPLSFALVSTLALSQEAATLMELQDRITLTKEELGQLLPKASMSRVTANGNKQNWKNDADGTFIIRSDNRGLLTAGSEAYGKWHISEDGRYCVLIEWKRVPTEEWCRFIVKAGDAYYATKSDKHNTEKVYKLEISK